MTLYLSEEETHCIVRTFALAYAENINAAGCEPRVITVWKNQNCSILFQHYVAKTKEG